MLREVNKTDPSFCPALVERVRLMSQAGESRQALRLLERAVRTAPRAVLLDELERVGEPHYSSRLRRLYRKLSCAKDINERLRDRVDRYLTQGAVARGGPSGNGDGPAVALQVCAECERPSFAWMPRCPGCGVWDSIDTGT